MNILAIIVLSFIIIQSHYMVKSSFFRVIIDENAQKNKVSIINKTPTVAKNTIHDYLKITNDVRCINITVNYLTSYLVFITIVYFVTSL